MIKKITWAELACAVAIVATLGLILLPALAAYDPLALRESCADNLRQLGVSLRMYAEEDAGGFFPPQAMYFDNRVDCTLVDDNGLHPPTPSDDSSSDTSVSFNIDTMYPDYVTDFTLFVCPADIGWTTEDLYSPYSGEIDLMFNCDSFRGSVRRGSVLLDLSYFYTGWYLDKTGDRPEWSVPHEDTFFHVPEWPPGTLLPAQYCAYLVEFFTFASLHGDAEFFSSFSRNDLTISINAQFTCGGDGAMPAGGWGNGEGSDELARLSTGLKRFIVTDALNPAKGVMAESEIFMMRDRVSVIPIGFNHVPDGGNVLFLDGHVEFVEYPGETPVNVGMAYMQSLIREVTPTPRGIGPPADVGEEGFGEGEFQTEGEDRAEIRPIEMQEVTPASGPVEGGNRVNLLGNFPAIATVSEAEAALVVTFGGEVAAFDDVLSKEVSGGVLFVTAPAQTFAGTEQVDVTVADASDGTNYSTLIAAYTYIVPDKGEQVGCGDLFTLLSQLETFMDEFGVSAATLESGGLPAEASLYLIDGVLCTNSGSALYTATLEALESNLASFDADDDARFLVGFREVVAALMVVSTETQQNFRGVFEPMGIVLANGYAVVDCTMPETCGAAVENGASLKTATEPYSGDGDIDNDGTSNRIEYDNIVGAGGGLNEFALVALDATTDGAPAEQEGSAEGSTEGEGTPASEGEAALEEGEGDGSPDGIIVCSPGSAPSSGGSTAWPDLALLLFCVFGLTRWKRRLVLPRQ